MAHEALAVCVSDGALQVTAWGVASGVLGRCRAGEPGPVSNQANFTF